MYLWKIKNLKQEIEEHKISKKENLQYLLLFTLLYVILLIQSIIQINTLWNIQMVVIQLSLSIFGIAYAYYRSQRKEFFLQDLSAIGFVFVLRSLFFMSLGMLNLYVMTHIFGVEKIFSPKNAIIVGMMFEVLLYWRIGSHIASLKS